jgi:predicted transcriptional regulator
MIEKELTDTELELMQVLWQKGEANARIVQESLLPEKELAYTSVSTILRILVKKGFCRIRSEGRNHFYVPQLSKEKYEQTTLKRMVDQVFSGNATQLVKQLVDTGVMSREEKSELLRLLEEGLDQ